MQDATFSLQNFALHVQNRRLHVQSSLFSPQRRVERLSHRKATLGKKPEASDALSARNIYSTTNPEATVLLAHQIVAVAGSKPGDWGLSAAQITQLTGTSGSLDTQNGQVVSTRQAARAAVQARLAGDKACKSAIAGIARTVYANKALTPAQDGPHEGRAGDAHRPHRDRPDQRRHRCEVRGACPGVFDPALPSPDPFEVGLSTNGCSSFVKLPGSIGSGMAFKARRPRRGHRR